MYYNEDVNKIDFENLSDDEKISYLLKYGPRGLAVEAGLSMKEVQDIIDLYESNAIFTNSVRAMVKDIKTAAPDGEDKTTEFDRNVSRFDSDELRKIYNVTRDDTLKLNEIVTDPDLDDLADVAKLYGISISQLRAILKIHGIGAREVSQVEKEAHTIDPDDLQDRRTFYNYFSKLGLKGLADKSGLSTYDIRKMARQHGMTIVRTESPKAQKQKVRTHIPQDKEDYRRLPYVMVIMLDDDVVEIKERAGSKEKTKLKISTDNAKSWAHLTVGIQSRKPYKLMSSRSGDLVGIKKYIRPIDVRDIILFIREHNLEVEGNMYILQEELSVKIDMNEVKTCSTCQHFETWVCSLAAVQVRDRLRKYGHVVGEIKDISVVEESGDLGGVTAVKLYDGRTRTVPIDEFMEAMGGDCIESKSFRTQFHDRDFIKFIGDKCSIIEQVLDEHQWAREWVDNADMTNTCEFYNEKHV